MKYYNRSDDILRTLSCRFRTPHYVTNAVQPPNNNDTGVAVLVLRWGYLTPAPLIAIGYSNVQQIKSQALTLQSQQTINTIYTNINNNTLSGPCQSWFINCTFSVKFLSASQWQQQWRCNPDTTLNACNSRASKWQLVFGEYVLFEQLEANILTIHTGA